ncbi:hypothetical protein, partial [Thiospirillum jenense]
MPSHQLHINRLCDCLQSFDFQQLFIAELGWSYSDNDEPFALTLNDQTWQVSEIAQLVGVVVFLIDGLPERDQRLAIQNELSERVYENLVIFVDSVAQPTQSMWLWLRRDQLRQIAREHSYMSGQPGDLFLSKLSRMVVDINELD